MNNDFVAEILRATSALQSGDPAGVTAIIQSALAAGGLTGAGGGYAGTSPGLGFELPQAALHAGAPHFKRGTADRPDPAAAATYPPNALGSQRLRKPLSEVLQTLSAGRKGLGLEGLASGLGAPVGVPDQPMPEGAEFRDLTHSCSAGTRRYRLYVPASARDGLQGLVVMLHGCTQNPEDFAAGTGMNAVAEEHRLLVVYPAQTSGDNAMSCWNWFRPGDQTRDVGEPAIIASLTTSIRDEFAVPHNRVFVAGLSAGGAMAAILGATHPDLYSAIGVHSGLAHGSANDVLSAFSAMRGQGGIGGTPMRHGRTEAEGPRVIVFHGDADATVHPTNADRIISSHGGDPATMVRSEITPSGGTRAYTRMVTDSSEAAPELELWMVEGAPHAWSGGHPSGSYTDPQGPNASREMVRFFLRDAATFAASPSPVLN